MCLRGRPRIYVERYTELFERAFDYFVVSVYNILWSNAFLPRFDGDRHAVFVATAYENHLFSLVAEITCVDIGGDVDPCQMPDMYGSIGVWQCCRYICASEIHIVLLFYNIMRCKGTKNCRTRAIMTMIWACPSLSLRVGLSALTCRLGRLRIRCYPSRRRRRSYLLPNL